MRVTLSKICKIKKISQAVRKALFEPIILKYNFSYDYECTCAISSFLLNDILNDFDIESQFVIGEYNYAPHAFNKFYNHVVDITATQFGKKKPSVVIEPLSKTNYNILSVGKDALKQLIAWPREQSPLSYKKELTLIRKNVTSQLEKTL